MKTKEEIVKNWLPRYTKRKLEDFAEYILLTNFDKYVELFAQRFNVPVLGYDANMISATAHGMTIINFGMGSPNAAIIMDLLGAIKPKACLFLGKCGGIDKKNKIGDFVLPLAAIRGEGTSNDYYPPEVPALPAFMLQRAVSSTIRDHARDYWTGTVYTTNRRIWEHDENFKEYLKLIESSDAKYAAAKRLNDIGSWHELNQANHSAGACDHITTTNKDIEVLKFEMMVFNEQIYCSDHAWAFADIKFK